MPTGSGGGLASVQTNTTLSGSGTAASPLSVKGWPLVAYMTPAVDTAAALTGVNTVFITGFILPFALTFSHIGIFITATDAVGNYDFGIYSQAGALLANIGAQHLPSNNFQSFATVQGSQTIAPGLYIFGWTGNATTATINVGQSVPSWVFNNNVAASVGGALPASIAAQSISPHLQTFYATLS